MSRAETQRVHTCARLPIDRSIDRQRDSPSFFRFSSLDRAMDIQANWYRVKLAARRN